MRNEENHLLWRKGECSPCRYEEYMERSLPGCIVTIVDDLIE